MENKKAEIGTITARNCPTCGHHEIGYVTEDGTFHPLSPGDRIQLLNGEPVQAPAVPLPSARDQPPAPEIPSHLQPVPWVPEPVRGNMLLRLKYGVMVAPQMIANGMTPALYEVAYRYKLMQLIEKAAFVPMPVILDQYFTASHLGGGDPREVMEAVMEELQEVSQPVELVQRWLEEKDERSLAMMIAPKSISDLNEAPCGDDQLARELDALSIEDFFEMLQ